MTAALAPGSNRPLADDTVAVSLDTPGMGRRYPLAGVLGSGPQVAQGAVSGLLGPGEDVRLLQITTPIQPGSSGWPLFDEQAQVMGVVVGSLTSSQNVNFAVRGTLAEALVEAAGHEPTHGTAPRAMGLADIARLARGSVWRLECKP